MADRHRSKDGKQETRDYVPDEAAPEGQGRDGGRLARQIGTRDEERRSTDESAGVTRVTKKDEDEENG